jgi:hypothetical protein
LAAKIGGQLDQRTNNGQMMTLKEKCNTKQYAGCPSAYQVFHKLKKYTAIFFILLVSSGCAMISKQYYYVPSVPHQTVKTRFGHSDFKMIYNKIRVSGQAGDSIASITVSNGIGHPLMMGPIVFPVIPVGGFFQKADSKFIFELSVNCSQADFMSMAIDSNDYKRILDSLRIKKIATKLELPGSACYMIVNDTLKIPLKTSEFMIGNTTGHSYWMTSAVPFRKIKTLKLVTGNPMLDNTLKNVTFNRRSRIKFDLIGPGY